MQSQDMQWNNAFEAGAIYPPGLLEVIPVIGESDREGR